MFVENYSAEKILLIQKLLIVYIAIKWLTVKFTLHVFGNKDLAISCCSAEFDINSHSHTVAEDEGSNRTSQNNNLQEIF